MASDNRLPILDKTGLIIGYHDFKPSKSALELKVEELEERIVILENNKPTPLEYLEKEFGDSDGK